MPTAPPGDAELYAGLEVALAGVGREPPLSLVRRPSPYRTSFPLEELELSFAGDERAHLAFKRLDWDGLETHARLAKPRFLHDPAREPAVYALLLEPAGNGAPRYFGSTIDPATGGHWLFLEWVEGRELYQVGEFELWLLVARWLGEMHRDLGVAVEGVAAQLPLLAYDASHMRRWIARAVEFRGGPTAPAPERRGLTRLAQCHDAVVEELAALPRTAIHGEFYASNVLVAGDASALRVAPVDWELAGIGPAAFDLAALVSGSWSAAERGELAAAYGASEGVRPVSSRELDLARLYLAIQWLGWAPPEWEPPEGQRHDWLAEAVAIAEDLGL